ncbi:hypothetical protein BASA81_001309 [Batrachochytrium salamandrivorans]|nr:hypothetical protein BASA81_001309 [Batrachochytrium salamandrivorans]
MQFDPNSYYNNPPPPTDEYVAGQQQQWYEQQPQTAFAPEPVPSGAMTGTVPSQRRVGSVEFFSPPPASSSFVTSGVSSTRFGLSTLDGELPLLMELGVDFTRILEKTKSALFPMGTIDPVLMSDGDLTGPFVFCLLLGFLLLFAGKLHFGYVFGFGVAGCWAIYMLLNLLCPKSSIELHVVFSVLGYALLPIVLLALVTVFVTLKQGGVLAFLLVPPSVLFSTFTATRFFEATLNAREQRYLIAYPVLLFFACFALITVF